MDPNLNADEVAQPAARSQGSGGATVLVIEDDKDLRLLIVSMLESLGYRAFDVPDVTVAREVLQKNLSIDVVLSEVVLSGGTNGPQFASELKETHPQLPVIFMSGYPADSFGGDISLDPDSVFLHKPFRRQLLAEALSGILARSRH